MILRYFLVLACACGLCSGLAFADPKRRGEIVLTATDDAGGVMTLRVPNGIFAQLQQPGSFGSVNLSQIGGASVASALYDSGNTALKVNCVVGCSAAAFADNSAFTAGTTGIGNIGGVFNDGLGALSSGNAAAPRITASRAFHVNLRDNSGNQLLGQAAMAASIPVTLASNQPAISVTPPSNASSNVAQFGGTNISTGTGAGGAGIPRVTLSNDSSLAANQSVNLAQVAGTNTVTGGVNGTQGVGGTAAAGSAVAGNPFVMAGNASGNVTRAIFCDTWKVVSQTASAQIITGVSAKQTYICNAFLNSATAQNINIVEGTGSTCATGTAGMLGGTTASTGPNLAANQGFILPASAVPWMKTATAADNVCILQSGTGQVSGVIVYTQF